MEQQSTCSNNNPACDKPSDESDKNPIENEIIVKDKIHRTPPNTARGRPPTKTVSNRSRSNSVGNRSKSHSIFSSQRRDSFSSLRSTPNNQSDGSSTRKRKKGADSPTPDETGKPEGPPIPVKSVSKTPNKTLCAVCSKTFHKDDSAIECECCSFWYHSVCQNLTEEAISAFKLLGDNATFFCLNCKAGAKVLFKGMQKLQDRMNSVDKEFADIKSKVETVKSTQKSNTTKLKTLQTVHGTLKTDVDNINTEMKSLKQQQKCNKEDNIKLQAQQQANSVSLTGVSTRLNTIEEDIIKRIDNIIDQRVEIKVKELQNSDAPIVLAEKIDDKQIEEVVNKQIVEKLSNDKDILTETISTKVTEAVTSVYSDNFPTLPTTNMEVDGESTAKIKVPPSFATAVNMVSKERDERQKRKLQLVITNLKEAVSTEADKKQVLEIFQILQVETNVTEVMRLGTRKANKPRVLRVSLENAADKHTILAKATSLRKLPEKHDYALVYIKPNLTPQQQEESKNLYIQLQEVKKKNPGLKYKISKGQIVQIPTPPQQQ